MNKMIAAVIVAAGKSSRMGPPKQLLPWQQSTVIETVVANLDEAGVSPLIAVLGREATQIASQLSESAAVILKNPDYQTTEMLCSFQIGLTYLQELDTSSQISGVLLSLGDQPQIPPDTIRQITTQIQIAPHKIIIPSYNMRRGHPFYLPMELWKDVLNLGASGTLRQLLQMHSALISYVNLSSDEILWDMDTPEDYAAMQARWA